MQIPPGGSAPPTPYTPGQADCAEPAPRLKRLAARVAAHHIARSASDDAAHAQALRFCATHIRPRRSLDHNVATLQRDIALAGRYLDGSRRSVLERAGTDVCRLMPDFWADQSRIANDPLQVDAYFTRQPAATAAYAMARACYASLMSGKGGRHQCTGRVQDTVDRLLALVEAGSAADDALRRAHRDLLVHLGPAPSPSPALRRIAAPVAKKIHANFSLARAGGVAYAFFEKAVVVSEQTHGNVGRVRDHLEALLAESIPAFAPTLRDSATEVEQRVDAIVRSKRRRHNGAGGASLGGFGGGGGGGGGGCGGGCG